MTVDAASKALEFRLQREINTPGVLEVRTVVVKKGPQVYKAASLITYGNPDTFEVKRRELRVKSYRARRSGPGFDFSETEHSWHCEDSEIERLQFLLNEELAESGTYSKVDAESAVTQVVAQLDEASLEHALIQRLTYALVSRPEFAETLAAVDNAALLAEVVNRATQKIGLQRLQDAVAHPESTESDLQRVLEEHWWMFGGRYINTAARRTLVVGEQLDIPLIRSDGTLHVVELKLANIPKLVVEHRGKPVAGPEVHLACSQAMGYLRSLDEHRAAIKSDLGIDCRRASATVVVGHPAFVEPFTEQQVCEAIRTYNAHLSRIEVITYADLIQSAERSLSLSEG
jgi:hypothetical protein